MAQVHLHPITQSASTVKVYNKSANLDLLALTGELAKQTEAVSGGDLKRSEAMLVGQAHVLDAIFNNLARRAINSEYLNQFDVYLKLGLRAQSQCRSTWEAISAIQNPPVSYQQTNIAALQQVNNTVPHDRQGTSNPRAGENEIPQNKLLEQEHHERLDTGTTGTTIEADTAMAALEGVNRTKKP